MKTHICRFPFTKTSFSRENSVYSLLVSDSTLPSVTLSGPRSFL